MEGVATGQAPGSTGGPGKEAAALFPDLVHPSLRSRFEPYQASSHQVLDVAHGEVQAQVPVPDTG